MGKLFAAAACAASLVLFTACGSNGGAGVDGGGIGSDATTTDGGLAVDANPACTGTVCPADQHCEVGSSGPECVNNTCSDLNCAATEECVMTPGGGAICEDIGCMSDIECPVDRFCNGTICVDDVCTQGASRCDGQDLYVCSPTGSMEELVFTCTGTSTCNDDGMGTASCDCGDDWDCPINTRCEGKVCVGTGDAPTCLLPPEPFTNALPVNEITWGGVSGATNAVLSPFSSHSQVTQQVVVANLDDDNGDGLIDDRDIPEIIFSSYCGSQYTTNGVIRAIHGGGPNKGKDFFAVCGGVVWKEGDTLPATCTCGSANLDPTASIAVGDIDYDGIPEIVTMTEAGSGSEQIRIFSNTGDIITTSPGRNMGGANPAPSIANLDNTGNAEIIVGRDVFAVNGSGGVLTFGDVWEGTGDTGTNGQGPASCVSNIVGDNRLEIVAGGTAYKFPVPPAGALVQADCTGAEVGDEADWCNGVLPTLWDVPGVGSGFCSLADVWGADTSNPPGPANPLDGVPELVLVASGNVYVVETTGGTIITTLSLPGSNGGPPNIDDFDGDGFPEIGTAGQTDYVMYDFQAATVGGECDAWTVTPGDDMTSAESVNTPRTPPGTTCTLDVDCGDTSKFACNEQTQQCICLHNSWRRRTEDSSSRVTGSSVFDFNGDGAAEVVYNDECRFRIYDGLDGTVYMREPSESRTRIEYPIIADVDNDGNAEIVFATSNESGFCSENLGAQYNNGIEVWGDQNDFWVSARRIWNQHAYNVTNITEDGVPPLITPQHWKATNGRTYNLYRSNPRNIGIAPDLVITGVQMTSAGGACGTLTDTIDIVVQVENQGDVRGGEGAVLGLYGEWIAQGVNEPLYADLLMTPLTFTMPASLDPGGITFITVQYNIANNSPNAVPDNVTTIIDDPSFNPPNGTERECDENNTVVTPTTGGGAQPDLRVELGTPVNMPVCPTVPTTVFNDGSVNANNVLVRFYAGDPGQGGTAVHDEVFASIPAGGNVSMDLPMSMFPNGVNVTIFAVVDPDNSIAECNDGNNQDEADAAISCGGID